MSKLYKINTNVKNEIIKVQLYVGYYQAAKDNY